MNKIENLPSQLALETEQHLRQYKLLLRQFKKKFLIFKIEISFCKCLPPLGNTLPFTSALQLFIIK
ncbi:hypothetical protein T03_51 [Trichinella britovi]|uniref:Uncharacterized protein n=1 Tax=Trichinella britovi TaxID=45882 RepID=A0A0V1D2X9_TRIBR|nr:hypothetical protein T03_51 [Trichinella britovi]